MSLSLVIDFNEEPDRAKLWRAMRGLRGRHRVEVALYRPRRSDRQNRFYWPAFVQPFAAFLREQGEGVTENDAHEILKMRFLRKTIVDEKTGEAMDYVGSTTTLTTSEFNEYLDRCAAWLADMFGFIFPDPYEYHEKNDSAGKPALSH